MLRLAVSCSLAVILSLIAGCGGASVAEVTGTVTVDGQPLQEGEIIFEAEDGQSTPAGTMIAGGKYLLKVAPGRKKVRINASRPTKIPDPVMGAAARESTIAAEFNVESKLTAQIKPGKQENVDFEVKSIP
jgi:hypothetical protein